MLARRLRLQQQTALAQRVTLYAPLVAKTDPALVSAMIDHGQAIIRKFPPRRYAACLVTAMDAAARFKDTQTLAQPN